MMRIVTSAALMLGLVWSVVILPAPTQAQERESSSLVRSSKITVDYIEPLNPILLNFEADDPYYRKVYKQYEEEYHAYLGIRERLQKRQLLEEFSQFLAPLRFPMTLRLQTKECGQSNAFYSRTDATLTLCYEYVKDIEDDAPKKTTPQGITRDDAIIGGVVGTLLHEAGHAVSHMFQLPVFAREEDTADQIAGYVMLQFGRDVARRLIKGTAYRWNVRFRKTPDFYWDVHSSNLQRQQTFLCLAYGKDPDGFADFVQFNWLPKARAPNCAAEYRQVDNAFKKTILPHVDREMMKQVLARKWLPENGSAQ